MTHPTYDPRDPIFNMATLPDEFSLADMAHYPDLPTGLSELTIDGPEIHARDIPLVRSESWRTFLLKESDGAAALVRLSGSRFNEGLLLDYLQTEATHVTGFHVREMGLLGAVLYDVAAAFCTTNMWYLEDQRHRLPEVPARALGTPSMTHRFHQFIVSIEIEERMPSMVVMLRDTVEPLRHWHHWVEAQEMLPEWIESGRLPLGISVYRETAPGASYALQTINQAPRRLSSSDVFVVTAPSGAVCMLCLDTLSAFAGGETRPDGQLMHWIELTQPRLAKEMLKGRQPGWNHIEALCLYAAESVMDAHRQEGVKAWPVKEMPWICSDNRLSPFVLAAQIEEPRLNALDMAKMMTEG